jgi:hypothetical protein
MTRWEFRFPPQIKRTLCIVQVLWDELSKKTPNEALASLSGRRIKVLFPGIAQPRIRIAAGRSHMLNRV